MRNSGGSGLTTTTGATPDAAATAAIMEPQPGRKSPPSIGKRDHVRCDEAARWRRRRLAAVNRSYVRSKSLPTATTVALR